MAVIGGTLASSSLWPKGLIWLQNGEGVYRCVRVPVLQLIYETNWIVSVIGLVN